MLYFLSDNENSLIYVSSGKLESGDEFILEQRQLDTFVICVGLKGTAYFRQNGVKYSLKKNNYLILFAGYEHAGFRKSDGMVSYYWCHFRIRNNNYRLVNRNELLSVIGSPEEGRFSQYYMLPEYDEISGNGRAIVIFRQLLDIARSNTFSARLPDYALSLLVMEISQEYIERDFSDIAGRKINPRLEKIVEWIRINYNLEDINLNDLARNFQYNPNYLCESFHHYMGVPLMHYITQVKLDAAKKLLLQTQDTVKEIAWKVGYGDEKTFMKRFKQSEDMSPSVYRNAFTRTKIVK
jgi:AraC-like DNA-binding protein